MNKFIKLISLIIISLSVYIIYNKTNNSCYKKKDILIIIKIILNKKKRK